MMGGGPRETRSGAIHPGSRQQQQQQQQQQEEQQEQQRSTISQGLSDSSTIIIGAILRQLAMSENCIERHIQQVDDRQKADELLDFLRNKTPPPSNYMSIPDNFAPSPPPSEHGRWHLFGLFRRDRRRKRQWPWNETRPPPVRLPDSAVVGRTIDGHRHIAISIPAEYDHLQPEPRATTSAVASTLQAVISNTRSGPARLEGDERGTATEGLKSVTESREGKSIDNRDDGDDHDNGRLEPGPPFVARARAGAEAEAETSSRLLTPPLSPVVPFGSELSKAVMESREQAGLPHAHRAFYLVGHQHSVSGYASHNDSASAGTSSPRRATPSYELTPPEELHHGEGTHDRRRLHVVPIQTAVDVNPVSASASAFTSQRPDAGILRAESGSPGSSKAASPERHILLARHHEGTIARACGSGSRPGTPWPRSELVGHDNDDDDNDNDVDEAVRQRRHEEWMRDTQLDALVPLLERLIRTLIRIYGRSGRSGLRGVAVDDESKTHGALVGDAYGRRVWHRRRSDGGDEGGRLSEQHGYFESRLGKARETESRNIPASEGWHGREGVGNRCMDEGRDTRYVAAETHGMRDDRYDPTARSDDAPVISGLSTRSGDDQGRAQEGLDFDLDLDLGLDTVGNVTDRLPFRHGYHDFPGRPQSRNRYANDDDDDDDDMAIMPAYYAQENNIHRNTRPQAEFEAEMAHQARKDMLDAAIDARMPRHRRDETTASGSRGHRHRQSSPHTTAGGGEGTGALVASGLEALEPLMRELVAATSEVTAWADDEVRKVVRAEEEEEGDEGEEGEGDIFEGF